jgi:hypothetical protein
MSTTLIDFANGLGDKWATWAIAGLLEAGVLLVVLSLLWLTIRRRVAPQIGYWLFLLVPLILLVSVHVTAPAAIARWTPSGVVSTWTNEAIGATRRVPRESRGGGASHGLRAGRGYGCR